MAGLLDYDKPDPLTLGLLGFSQAISTPRSRGGGVAAALGAFPAGQMQAAQMQRRREQDALRQQLAQAQVDNYRSEAEARKRRAEQEAATAAAIRQATQGAMVQSPGSLGGGVTPGSEQGRMLLEQFGDDPQFAMQGLPGLNAALNTVGPQQQVQAPGMRFDPEEFARRLEASGMPLEAAEYRKKLMGEDKTSVVAPGSALVSSRGEVRFSNPAPPKEVPQPEIVRLMKARDALPLGDPQRAVLDDVINKARRDRPLVSVDARTTFPKAMAPVDAGFAEKDMARWESARAARASIRSLQQASPGAASGPAANAAVSTIDFLDSVGLAGSSLKDLSANTAQFNAAATQLVLANIKQLGANPSNADLNEIKRLVPQLTTSKAARDRVAQVMLKYTNRAEFDARHRFDYIQKNQSSANWTPMKVNEMPSDQKALMPGALYQHPVTQEIARYIGNGQFETLVGDD
jgi:hypothetical protein